VSRGIGELGLAPKLHNHKRALAELADAATQFLRFEQERLAPDGQKVGDENERSERARRRFEAAVVRARDLARMEPA
jgi:hypothetical protein